MAKTATNLNTANRIKIISDGTICGTRIVNSETGEQIHGVTAFKLEMDAKKLPSPRYSKAIIEFAMPVVEFEAPVNSMTVKYTKTKSGEKS
jgi:hypothetical protein